MNSRLSSVLELLRSSEQERPNVRINLLFSIAAHAVLCGDKEMEDAANQEIARIQRIRQEQADAKAAGQGPAGAPAQPPPA